MTVAYFTNKIYVFESRSFSPAVLVREIILFAGARIFSLVCEMGFMWLTVDLMGWRRPHHEADRCCVRRYYQLRIQQAFYFQEQ